MFLDRLPYVKQVASTLRTLDKRTKAQDDALSAHLSGDLQRLDHIRIIRSDEITRHELQALAREWFPRFNQQKNRSEGENEIYNIACHVQAISDLCVGRVGAGIKPMILRVLTARSIDEGNLDILEVGTLFGASLAAVYDCCAGFFERIHITAIDPLTGYYQRTADPVTVVPVTAPMFRRNMARFDIPETDYTLICKKSQEPDAISEAGKRSYNLLIIDGDHTDFAVSHDYRAYRPMVRDGGYIIFDDWGDAKWGIDTFIERELCDKTDIQLVGAAHRTAIYRATYRHES